MVLFIPTIALAYFVTQPDTPFWLMLCVAATAGLGGGNFASSMANISFFYPDRMKGWALGLNAAGGNIGVSSVQLLTPILMGIGFINLYQATPVNGVYLQNAGLMWLLPLVIAVTGAALFMNNLTSAKASLKDQLGSSSASTPGSCPTSISGRSDPSSATRPHSRCCSRPSFRKSRSVSLSLARS